MKLHILRIDVEQEYNWLKQGKGVNHISRVPATLLSICLLLKGTLLVYTLSVYYLAGVFSFIITLWTTTRIMYYKQCKYLGWRIPLYVACESILETNGDCVFWQKYKRLFGVFLGWYFCITFDLVKLRSYCRESSKLDLRKRIHLYKGLYKLKVRVFGVWQEHVMKTLVRFYS